MSSKIKRLLLTSVVAVVVSSALIVSPFATAAERARRISFDDIKFAMKKGDPFKRSMLSDNIEGLAGKTVTVRGWIHPTFTRERLTQFVLVRCNNECCFGPEAALYDSIQVRMDPGKSIDFTVQAVVVEGVFAIREFKIDGVTYSVYEIQASKAKK